MSYSLPTTVNAGGVELRIRSDGDYRIVLDTFSVLEDVELDKTERILAALCIFYEDFEDADTVLSFHDIDDAVEGMFNFFKAGYTDEDTSSKKLIDWVNDEPIVCAAVNSVSNKEIRLEPYLHWWTFMSYYMSVGESILSTVVSIRDKIVRDKKLEKWEREYRRDNPKYFRWNSKTAEELEVENWLMSNWNNEG